jgi:hypothetical protein
MYNLRLEGKYLQTKVKCNLGKLNIYPILYGRRGRTRVGRTWDLRVVLLGRDLAAECGPACQ